MDLFAGPQQWSVQEQIVEDSVSGLTIQFEALDDGQFALRIFSEQLPFGNRELIFDAAGNEAGAGSAVSGPRMPTWELHAS